LSLFFYFFLFFLFYKYNYVKWYYSLITKKYTIMLCFKFYFIVLISMWCVAYLSITRIAQVPRGGEMPAFVISRAPLSLQQERAKFRWSGISYRQSWGDCDICIKKLLYGKKERARDYDQFSRSVSHNSILRFSILRFRRVFSKCPTNALINFACIGNLKPVNVVYNKLCTYETLIFTACQMHRRQCRYFLKL